MNLYELYYVTLADFGYPVYSHLILLLPDFGYPV